MTANLTIETAKKDSVIAIPQRAVISDDDRNYVRILLKSGDIEEREVVRGLRGSGGLVEIVSGLEEGDNVITFIQEN